MLSGNPFVWPFKVATKSSKRYQHKPEKKFLFSKGTNKKKLFHEVLVLKKKMYFFRNLIRHGRARVGQR